MVGDFPGSILGGGNEFVGKVKGVEVEFELAIDSGPEGVEGLVEEVGRSVPLPVFVVLEAT